MHVTKRERGGERQRRKRRMRLTTRVFDTHHLAKRTGQFDTKVTGKIFGDAWIITAGEEGYGQSVCAQQRFRVRKDGEGYR